MITIIHFHPDQQAKLNQIDQSKLEKEVLSYYPYPLAVSFRNFMQAVQRGDGQNILTTFAYDLTTSVFQFLALVLASDYHENRNGNSLKIYNAIADMSHRPGPGKWLGFLKIYPDYVKHSQDDNRFAFGELTRFIEANIMGKKSQKLTIEENHGNSPSKQTGLLEFMVMFRNNMAHSKGYLEKDLENLSASVTAYSFFLFNELSFLANYKLTIKSNEIPEPVYMVGDQLVRLPEIDINEHLFLEKGSNTLKLFPLIISDKLSKSKPEDLFLLESIDNDRVFFSGNRIMTEKLKGRDGMANKVFDFLKNIYAEPDVLQLKQVTWDQFRKRGMDYSQQVLSDYVINNKYNEAVYVFPDSYNNILDDFRASGKQIVFLTGGQGVGKSAFCAHLTQQSLIGINNNETSMLIDARLLDELKDEQDLFLEFIKKKLGLQGDLPEFFSKLQGENADYRITLIIDNMNEYFLKERDQSFLLEQLFDTVNKLTGLSNIQIIAIARPEYYVKSFEKYVQSFTDFVEHVTHKPTGKATTLLPVLDESETEKIWNNYQEKYTGYSPLTRWPDLNISVRESCQNPLIMLFLLKRYDNEKIPFNLTIEKIKKQYIRGILKSKELKKTLFYLVKKMHKEQRPYLLTESFTKEEISELFDSTKEKKTSLPRNYAYTKLVDMQILREERVEKDGKSGKKISVNNEMTQDVIISEYDRWTRRTSLFVSFAIVVGLSLIMLILLGYISNLSKTGLNNNQKANIEALEYLKLKDYNFGHDFFAIVDQIYQSNYPLIFMYRLIFTIIRLVFFGLLIVFVLVFLISALLEYHMGKKFEKLFSFFEIMHFREVAKKSGSRLIKIALPGLLLIFTFGLVVMIKAISSDINYKIIQLIVVLCVFYLLFLIVFFARNNFLNIKKEGRAYEKYYMKSNYRGLNHAIIIISVFLFLTSLMLVNSESWNLRIITGYNERYSSLFAEQTNELKDIAEPNEISLFKEILYSYLQGEGEEDKPVLMKKSLLEVLEKGDIDFLGDQTFAAAWVEDNIGAGRKLFKEYWIYVYSFVAALLLILFAAIKIPSLLNRRLLNKQPEIKIV